MDNTGTKGLLLATLFVAGCASGSAAENGGMGAGPGVGGSGGATTGVVATTGVDGGGGIVDPDICVPGIAATSQVPRIANEQYDRTVRDLLGVTTLAASGNVVPSTAVGQMRIKYYGNGLIKDNLSPGWLVRIFNKVF